MSDDKNQEKTERATPKRRRDARKKGQVALSKEISSAFVLLVALVVFYFSGSWMFSKVILLMREAFQNIETLNLTSSSFQPFLINIINQFILIISPLVCAIMVMGIISNVVQTGFLFSTEAITFKLSKINPVKGLKRLYSLRSLVELVKSLTKISLVGGIAFFVLKSRFDNVLGLIQLDVLRILTFIASEASIVGFYTFGFLVVLAIFDYAFQRWHHEKDLRMTKQEVKEEMKHTEGDPKIKARIRSIQQEMSRNRMMAMVPDATVVITNPTHLSIALKYDTEDMLAPKVIAKGAGIIAEKIKEVATQNNIPIVEEKNLARILYKTVEINSYIPIELYQAVAEIIAYVYKLGQMSKKE